MPQNSIKTLKTVWWASVLNSALHITFYLMSTTQNMHNLKKHFSYVAIRTFVAIEDFVTVAPKPYI